jgi:hypothetical protein
LNIHQIKQETQAVGTPFPTGEGRGEAFLQKLAQIIKFFVFILFFVFDFLDSFVYYCFRLYLLFYFCQSDNLFGQSNKN